MWPGFLRPWNQRSRVLWLCLRMESLQTNYKIFTKSTVWAVGENIAIEEANSFLICRLLPPPPPTDVETPTFPKDYDKKTWHSFLSLFHGVHVKNKQSANQGCTRSYIFWSTETVVLPSLYNRSIKKQKKQ